MGLVSKSCLLGLVVALVPAVGAAQANNTTRPKHGLELSYVWNCQLPAKVTSADGSDVYVDVSDRSQGFRIAVGYGFDLTERTSAYVGLQAGRTPFSFKWSGDPSPLGAFAAPNGRPTGIGFHWETRGASFGIETALRKRPKSRLIASVGTLFEAGFGGANFVVRDELANGTEIDVFRFDAEFNGVNMIMAGMRAGGIAEWMRPNFDRIRVGIGYCAMLSSNNMRGTYLARTATQGVLQGQFSSSLSTVFIHAGYLFSWGYPKVPKRSVQE